MEENNIKNEIEEIPSNSRLVKGSRAFLIFSVVFFSILFFLPQIFYFITQNYGEETSWAFLIGSLVFGPYVSIFVLIVLFLEIYLGFRLIKKAAKKIGLVMILFPFVIILVFSLNRYILPKYKHTSSIQATASQKYEEFTERFKNPQKVISVSNEAILLDGYVSVVPIVNKNEPINQIETYGFTEGWERKNAIKKYLEDNVLNKEVIIKLPDKEYFLESYCCYDATLERPEINLPQDVIIRAYVYVNDKLININDYPLEN